MIAIKNKQKKVCFCFVLGFLMTGNTTHAHQGTFECFDRDPEYLAGQAANDNGARIYLVRPGCNNGGHCPPYVADKEITCVVCSK